MINVEIASIGDEILRGMTINGNAAFLGRELNSLGYRVLRHTVFPDDPETIRLGLKECLSRSSFVIATGGLGPTLDDLTLQAALPLFSEKPLPLKNTLGTAPGLFGNGLLLLPGIPREMERMFLEEALPLLQKRFPLEKNAVFRRCTLCLLRELEVDPFLRELQKPDLEIGIYPAYGTLQITLRGAQSAVGDATCAIQERFPTFFIGEGRIEEAIHREMIARKKTVALAESCTGGAIAARLVSVPGASLFFLGSIVAYANGWKEHFLNVRHDTLKSNGVVSCETAIEMVEGLFEESDADYAIAVSGILGPVAHRLEKPAGTVCIALAKRGEKIDAGFVDVSTDRAVGIELSVHTALGALWRRLVHNTPTFS